MDNVIKTVEIVFENLDYVRIPMEYIEGLSIKDITSSIDKVAINTIRKYSFAREISIVINKSINSYIESAEDTADMYVEFDKRILKNDITYLRMHYMNGNYEDIYAPWQDYEDNEYKNQNQQVCIDGIGSYVVEIKQI